MQKYIILSLALALVGIMALILFSGEDRPKPVQSKMRQPDLPVTKGMELPPRTSSANDVPPTIQKAPETLVELVRVGLLGQSEKWTDSVMRRAGWTKRAENSLSYQGQDEVQIKWIVNRGLITGAEAQFGENAVSASVSALAPFFVGEHFGMPVHFESDKPLVDPVLFSNFIHDDGRRFFVRAQMRNSGPSPYGPTSLSISLSPFEGQSHAQSPQENRWDGVEERASKEQ